MKPQFAVVALCLLAGCQPQTKYEWGAYPNALLAYYQPPADRAQFDKALDAAIVAGEAKHKVPPGLYAEAGYEAQAAGNRQKAIEFFNREKAAWPESAQFMDTVIAKAGNVPQATVDNRTAGEKVQ
jgi:hypothetical protein